MAVLGLGRPDEAAAAFSEALERALTSGIVKDVVNAELGIALAACNSDPVPATRLYEAVIELRSRENVSFGPREREFERRFVAPLLDVAGTERSADEYETTSLLSFDETLELARTLAERTQSTRNEA